MTASVRDRLEQALTVLRQRGVAVVFDLDGSSTVRDQTLDAYLSAAIAVDTDLWVGAHVGTLEGGGAFWDDAGVLRYRFDDSRVAGISWSHNHRQPAAARLLVEVFAAAGLPVSWDGGPSCVRVVLDGPQ